MFTAFSSILLHFWKKINKIIGIIAICQDKECLKCIFISTAVELKVSSATFTKVLFYSTCLLKKFWFISSQFLKISKNPFLPTTLWLPKLSTKDILQHILLCSGFSCEDYSSSRAPFSYNQRNTDYDGVVWSRYHAGFVALNWYSTHENKAGGY